MPPALRSSPTAARPKRRAPPSLPLSLAGGVLPAVLLPVTGIRDNLPRALGRSQVVRHRILIPAYGGSNPPAPASLCLDGHTMRTVKELVGLDQFYDVEEQTVGD